MTTLSSSQHLLAGEPVAALLQRLAGEDGGQLYAVVDAARDEEVLRLLALNDTPFASLYQGKLQPLMSVSPFLVQFHETAEICRWLTTTAWGDSCGMLCTVEAGLQALAAHLSGLVIAEDARGVEVFFRYYDPRVLPAYLPSCTGEELDRFFGPVRRLMVEAPSGEEVLVFGREEPPGEGGRASSPGPERAGGGRLHLRAEQEDALLLAAEGEFLERLHAHMKRHFPGRCAHLGEQRVRKIIRQRVVDGSRHGIHTERGLAHHVRAAFSRRNRDV